MDELPIGPHIIICTYKKLYKPCLYFTNKAAIVCSPESSLANMSDQGDKKQLTTSFFEIRKPIASSAKDSAMLEQAGVFTTFGSNPLEISRTESSRKRNQAQGKLLLVALLENYCMLYDQSKEQNQQLFFMLCQYLCRMGIIDSTDFLEEFTSVRASYKRAFKELVIKALVTVKQMEDEALGKRELIVEEGSHSGLGQQLIPKHIIRSPHIGARLKLPQTSIPIDITALLDTKTSRFEEDFEEIGLLGRGAFGKVLHCRNKMDSRSYAVKIVKTDSSGGSELAKILREVKLLADIEHQNVVRYYGSWFQFTTPSSKSNTTMSDSETDDDDSIPISSSAMKDNVSESIPSANFAKSKPLTLFIQMELCQHTLKNWIEDLNREINTFRRIEGKILYCILDLLLGIACIHEKKYIHRDIKPSNIYWKFKSTSTTYQVDSSDRIGCWKIGDFGLATWISSNQENLTLEQQQSYGIGTIAYASPEQLEEKKTFNATYSFETDIYSLGLILFELLHPFETGMERVKVLTDLRMGIMSDEFVTAMPKEAALILWMISPNPKMRPSVADILKLEWFSQQDSQRFSGESDDLQLKLEIAHARILELEMQNEELKAKLAAANN